MSHLFHPPFEAALYRRGAFAPVVVVPPAFGLGAARRRAAGAPFEAAAWTWDALWARRVFAPLIPAPVGGDGGRSAALTAVFSGKGADPYSNLGLGAEAFEGLGADATQVLAVQIGASFSGKSAARLV